MPAFYRMSAHVSIRHLQIQEGAVIHGTHRARQKGAGIQSERLKRHDTPPRRLRAASRSCSISIRRTTRPAARPSRAHFRRTCRRSRKAKSLCSASAFSTRRAKRASRAKHGLTFPLLADADHAVAEKYGVWQKKSLYGRQFMGIARTTYLIGADGKVVMRWDKVKVNGHAEAVLDAWPASAASTTDRASS